MAMNFKSGKRYSAKESMRDGHVFPSKLEAAVYDILRARELAGEIEIEKLQDNVHLSLARILYIADFKIRIIKTGEAQWVEGKGFVSSRWPTIKKLWKAYGPGPLTIYTGLWSRPYLDEVIVPRKQLDLAE